MGEVGGVVFHSGEGCWHQEENLKIGIENLIMINHFGERNFWRTPEFPLMVAHGRSAVTLPNGIATRRTTWIFFFFFFFFFHQKLENCHSSR